MFLIVVEIPKAGEEVEGVVQVRHWKGFTDVMLYKAQTAIGCGTCLCLINAELAQVNAGDVKSEAV